jgi:hypothetical protein
MPTLQYLVQETIQPAFSRTQKALMRFESKEPNVPVQPIVVWRTEAWYPVNVAWFARKLEFRPRLAIVASLYDSLEASLSHTAKRTVRIDKPKGIKAGIHELMSVTTALKQVINYWSRQVQNQRQDGNIDAASSPRRCRFTSAPVCLARPSASSALHESGPTGIVETRKSRNYSKVIEDWKVAREKNADHEESLEETTEAANPSETTIDGAWQPRYRVGRNQHHPRRVQLDK